MAVDVTYVCDGGEFVWLEGKKYRCLKNAQDMLHSCTSNMAIQVFVLCTIENDGLFEECNVGNEERRN